MLCLLHSRDAPISRPTPVSSNAPTTSSDASINFTVFIKPGFATETRIAPTGPMSLFKFAGSLKIADLISSPATTDSAFRDIYNVRANPSARTGPMKNYVVSSVSNHILPETEKPVLDYLKCRVSKFNIDAIFAHVEDFKSFHSMISYG